MVAFLFVLTDISSNCLTNFEGFGKSKVRTPNMEVISAVPCAVLNASEVIKFRKGKLRSIGLPELSTLEYLLL